MQTALKIEPIGFQKKAESERVYQTAIAGIWNSEDSENFEK